MRVQLCLPGCVSSVITPRYEFASYIYFFLPFFLYRLISESSCLASPCALIKCLVECLVHRGTYLGGSERVRTTFLFRAPGHIM